MHEISGLSPGISRVVNVSCTIMVQSAFRTAFAAQFRCERRDFHKLFNKTVENFHALFTERHLSYSDSATQLRQGPPLGYKSVWIFAAAALDPRQPWTVI
jgi:hypothetical protein